MLFRFILKFFFLFTLSFVSNTQKPQIYVAEELTINSGSELGCQQYFDEFFKCMVADVAEVQPEFVGGSSEMYKYLGKELKLTSEERENIGDYLNIRFMIDETGKAIFQDIQKSAVSVGKIKSKVETCITNMPLWKPGKCNGKHLAVKFNLPVRW